MTIRPEPLCHFGGRLYFTSFPHPPPKPELLNNAPDVPDYHPPIRGQPQASTSATPDEDAKYYYFTLDDQLHYLSFFQDWGPLNLAMVYKACILIHELLQDQDLSSYRLVLYSSTDPRRKANAALLMSLYMLIVQRRPPWEAFHPIAEVEFMPFRDAGRGRSDFNLSIQDCLWGIWKAMSCGLCDMNEFDVEDYEYYEKVENGDWNWLTPNFIAFASPVDPTFIKKERERRAQGPQTNGAHPSSPVKGEIALQRKLPTPFQNCLDYFERRNVKLVVRLNNALYDRQHFLDRGINHADLYFDDGTNPTDEIVRAFIDMADEVVEAGGVVAVHCKAGLGRTGTLIGAYLTWKYGFTAPEAIAFMRIVRPGSVVGPQQQYMYTKQLDWARWAAVDEFKRQQSTTVITRTEIVAPATPPADSESDEEMVIAEVTTTVQTTATTGTIPIVVSSTPPPPKTPRRNEDVALAAITPPGQPRKTPATKRSSNVLDSDSEDDVEGEEADVLPALAVSPRKIRPRPASSMAVSTTRSRGITASEQRPMRVTRSTAAAAAATRRPVTRASGNSSGSKSAGQAPPSKVPRLANGTSVRGTAAATMAKTCANAAASGPGVRRLRRPASPTPSRLPTLRRTNLNGNENAATGAHALNGKVKGKAAGGGEWVSNNAAVVVVPRTKSERPVLRPTRRRRSSFSAADVVA